MDREDRERRRLAKRFNERLKLAATFLNNVGVATLIGGVVLPTLSGAGFTFGRTATILGLALGAHAVGQALMTLLRSED